VEVVRYNAARKALEFKSKTEALLVASKEIGLEVNAERTK
jgi:hypothetical protein